METRIFGVAFNILDFAEVRHIYTDQQLMQYDPANMLACPMGGYSGVTASRIKYEVSKPLKDLDEVREFLLNRNGNVTMCDPKKNYVGSCIGWEVGKDCLFTGKPNPTTAEYIVRLNLVPSEMFGNDVKDEKRVEKTKGYTRDKADEATEIIALSDVVQSMVKTDTVWVFTEAGNICETYTANLVNALLQCESYKDELVISDTDGTEKSYIFDDITMISDARNIPVYISEREWERQKKNRLTEMDKEAKFNNQVASLLLPKPKS